LAEVQDRGNDSEQGELFHVVEADRVECALYSQNLAHSRLDVDGMDDRQEWKTLTVSRLSIYPFDTEDEL
jgi:hypothetical protein